MAGQFGTTLYCSVCGRPRNVIIPLEPGVRYSFFCGPCKGSTAHDPQPPGPTNAEVPAGGHSPADKC